MAKQAVDCRNMVVIVIWHIHTTEWLLKNYSQRILTSCLSGCNVRALRPNGWTDQDETWHAGRPRSWPHCVRWGPSSPSPKGVQPPQFSAHISCGQMAASIKMSLGMEPPIFGPCLLWINGWMDEAGTWHGGRPQPRRLCVRWGPSPFPKRRRSPSPIFGPFVLWPNGCMHQDAT